MSGIHSMLLAGSSFAGGFKITSGYNTYNYGPGNTYISETYGWNSVSGLATVSATYPNTTIGSLVGGLGLPVISGYVYYNGLQIVGCWAADLSAATDRSFVVIIVLGQNKTSGISSIMVNGNIIPGLPTYTSDATNNITRIQWDVSYPSGLFGSVGQSRTIMIQ